MGLPKKQEENVRHNEQKWTKPLWDLGWTGMPNIFLNYQRELDLDPVDLNIILQIAKYWWYEDNLPRPAKTTIAKAINRHPRTVQRHIARLERTGYIRRIERMNEKRRGQGANEYDLAGLIKAVTPFVKKETEKREQRRFDDDLTHDDTGVKPGLKVVPNKGSAR